MTEVVLNFEQLIIAMTGARRKSETLEARCQGREVSPNGKRIGDPCLNLFEVSTEAGYEYREGIQDDTRSRIIGGTR